MINNSEYDICPKCGGLVAWSGYFQQYLCTTKDCRWMGKNKKSVIYLLLGPSGSGKTTIAKYLEKLDIPELISTTTRKPRKGESEGSPYYFVAREEFMKIPMIEFTEYNGNLYGTSKAEIERIISQDKDCFAIVDKHGINAFKELYGDLVKVIYIWVPVALAVERMRSRGDNEDLIVDRVRHAFNTFEFDNFDIADYCIINKDLDSSVKQLKAIVNK